MHPSLEGKTLHTCILFNTFRNIYIWNITNHYIDVMMGGMASQITSLTIVYSAVYSGADQRKHQSPASLAFVRGIHRWPVNSQHKWPVTRKMFPLDDVIMLCLIMMKYVYNPHIVYASLCFVVVSNLLNLRIHCAWSNIEYHDYKQECNEELVLSKFEHLNLVQISFS